MTLTDLAIRQAKPIEKPVKLYDERGLFLIVTPSGGRWWRFRYAFAGKENLLSFGVFPDVSLKEARARREAARKLLAQGIDPGAERRASKAAVLALAQNCFERICREWLEQRKGTVEPAQHVKTMARLENDVFPWLGAKPITEITAPDVLNVLRRIDQRGARYTAHRVRSEISQAFRYAIATGRADRDPCPDLKGAIPAAKETHFAAATTPKAAAELLRAIDGFEGTFVVQCALRLAPLLFVRPGELRQAEWSGVDLDQAQWRYLITKTRTEHLVPLAPQAVAILRELHPLTGGRRYVFPGRDPNKAMSAAAINAALRRMGYDTKTEITGHGFRAMARTILHEELRIDPAVIEHQLGHAVPDALGGAYNRTKFLDARRAMMNQWADYLEGIKAGAEVVAIPTAA
ncbi:integrase arm-type DNA-binding domain-containing protein [Accumulibacter sp.]|uniref:tyrosine-type recombinase/integrase n=1 Tax=Accumulibacter sp. TaxID=2053492 RepID=UPI002587A915|nr:integrase arm-type DNA-binding domain-containing protein [Accumulibacter sp.]